MLAAATGCAPSGGGPSADSATPRYPRITDVPDRPEGLPSEEQLTERRRRLEADRDSALGRDPALPVPPPTPDPLPALTETMQDLPVATAPASADAARAGVSVQVATVFFPADSIDLDEQMIEVLSQVAREQQAIGGGLRLVGHGPAAASEDLARRQLAEIGRTLVRMGVPPTRIDSELAEPGGGGGDHGRAVIYLDY